MRKFLTLFVAALFGATTFATAAKVYFVNADGWEKVNAYMWDASDNKNAAWPGVEMTKTANKAHEKDVYEYEVPDGFSNLIFNDGSSQTPDLTFNAAKPYYFKYMWYASLAEVEAAPADGEKVKLFFVNKDNWTKVQAYVFDGEARFKNWPGEEMAKTSDKALEKDIYSYEFPAAFPKIIFNNKVGDEGTQTEDLVWDKDKPYFYNGTWFATKEDVKDVVKDPEIKIAGAWDVKDGNWVLNELKLATDKKTATIELDLEAKSYEFKMIVDGAWKTKANSGNAYELKRDWPGVKDVKDDATENLKLIADAAGKYLFTWTLETDSLGITFPAKEEPKSGFFITGDSAFVKDAADLDKAKAWDPAAIKSEKDTAIFNLKAGIDYQMKITVDGTWATAKSFNDLTDKTNLKAVDDGNGGQNISFQLKAAGEVKVVYFVKDGVAIFKVLGGFVEPAKVEDGYYLIGQKGWEIDKIDVAQKFALNGEKTDEYVLKTTLVKDQEIKVVEVKDNAIKTWFPDGMDNAYKVDDAHAGEKDIYFKPAGSEDDVWKAFGGFIFIEANEAPQPEAGFYITGDSALVVDAGLDKAKAWNPDAIKSDKDTFVLSLKKDVDYLLKITVDGTWATAKSFNDLTDKTNLNAVDDGNGGQNIGFKLKEAGKVEVVYFVKDGVAIFKVLGNFVEVEVPTIEDGYYLIGQKGWEIDKIDVAQKFALNGESTDEYVLETTLVKDQEIKVVEVKDNEIKTWFPDGMDNAYKVDDAHAGQKHIYFKPAGSEDDAWKAFGGFIFIEAGETPPGPQPTNGFYVTGNEALVVDAGLDKAKAWNPDAIKSEKDTLVLNLKKDVEYALKVTLDGQWETAKGFSDLSDKTNLAKDKDNNICFKLKEDGEVKVIYNATEFKLLGNFVEVEVVTIPEGFYLIGQKGWDESALSADLKFELNEGSTDEYKLEVTLVEGDKLKVVKVENNAIVKWYPEGMGTDYVVDAAHAGHVTIYFKEAGSDDWKDFGGFFYIEGTQAIDNTAIDAKAVKFFENGQLVIIKNGVKYNAQGAVIR